MIKIIIPLRQNQSGINSNLPSWARFLYLLYVRQTLDTIIINLPVFKVNRGIVALKVKYSLLV